MRDDLSRRFNYVPKLTGRSDRVLGMDRPIRRRDFLHGAGVALGALATSGRSRTARADVGPAPNAGPFHAPRAPGNYPPARSGLRGSHPGSFEIGHALGREGRTDFGPVADASEDIYDLVVVGAGVSGLAAAYFYANQRPGARILVLDNHDDFGGHAKRNEFELGDRTLLGYGGSQSMERPGDYSDISKKLLRDLQVDTRRFESAYDREFFRERGLASGIFFDRATYGTDRLVQTDWIDPSLFLPAAKSGVSLADAVARMPISETARAELLRLASLDEDALADVPIWREPGRLRSKSYRDFLVQDLGVRDPQVFALLQDMPSGYFGVGIDAVPALDALLFGLPGIGGTSLGRFRSLIDRAIRWWSEPYIYHFPDGNASVARLLVRRLVPDVAAGVGMEDVVTAPFDYARLDDPDSSVRIRLASTVVRVAHEGNPKTATEVSVVYVRNGRAERVRARRCVLACWHAVIPYLCPELPGAQRQALSEQVKVPLVYTNVVLRQAKPMFDAGVALVHSPGSWHTFMMFDFPVSLGDYAFGKAPSDPIVLHMNRVPCKPGLAPKDQHRAGRTELYTTSYETIEREIRTHLGGMLGPFGFDPASDIAGITVNRWPHGYTYTYNPLFDPEYGDGEAPHEIARQRFGRITLANSDAGARAYLDCAIDQAWRAISELPT